MEILKRGRCPDSQNTYARSAERVNFGASSYYAGIGNFAIGVGVCVYSYYDNGDAHNNLGVVPGAHAEVPQAIGT